MFRDEGPFACALRALDRGDFGNADGALSELLGREWSAGDRAFLINKRGVARIGLEQRELARADFEEALRIAPSHAPALTNLGNLLLEEGDVDGAIARYEAAIAADAYYPVAHLNFERRLQAQGTAGRGGPRASLGWALRAERYRFKFLAAGSAAVISSRYSKSCGSVIFSKAVRS